MLDASDFAYLDSRTPPSHAVQDATTEAAQPYSERLWSHAVNFPQAASAALGETIQGVGDFVSGKPDFMRDEERQQRQQNLQAGNILYKPRKIGPAGDLTDQVTDVALGGIAPELPALLIPGSAVGRGARFLGAGARAAGILGDVASGGLSGLRESGQEGAIQAGEFGLQGAIGSLVPGGRPLMHAAAQAVAGAGIPLADQAIRGNDPLTRNNVVQAGVMAALPFAHEAGARLFGQRAMRGTLDESPVRPTATTAETPTGTNGIPANWKLRSRTETADGAFEHVFDTPQGPQTVTHPEPIGGEVQGDTNFQTVGQPYGIDPLPRRRMLQQFNSEAPTDVIEGKFTVEPPRQLGMYDNRGTGEAVPGTPQLMGRDYQPAEKGFVLGEGGEPKPLVPDAIATQLRRLLGNRTSDESAYTGLSNPFLKAEFASNDNGPRLLHATDLEVKNPGQLVVAARSPNGEVITGNPGELHANLNYKDGSELGFATPDGVFLTRSEASSHARKLRPLNPNEGGGAAPELLHSLGYGALGAGIGYALPGTNDEKKARALTFGAIGALGGAGKRFFKRVASDEGAAAGRRTLTGIGEQTLTGRARRLGEKQFKLGQSPAVDVSKEQARGNVMTVEADVVKDLRAAMPHIQNLTTPQRDAVKLFMASDRGAGAQALLSAAALPKPVEDFALKTTKNKGILQKMIADAQSDPQKAALINSTLGNYVTEPYRAFQDNARWRKEGTASESLKEQIVKENMALPQYAHMTEDAVRSDVEDWIKGVNNFEGDFSRMQNEGQTRMSQSLFTARKTLRPSVQQILGKIHDPVEREMLTVAKLAKSAVTAKQITELMAPHSVDEKGNRLVMKRPEWQAAIDAARIAGDASKVKFLTESFEPMPDTPGLGSMGGSNMMAQRQVMDAMAIGKGHDKSSWGDAIMKALAPLNKIPKAAHTLYNPSTHIHNLAQMLLMPAAAGMSPLGFFQHTMAIAQDAKKLRWAKEDGMMDAHLGSGEFRRTADSFDKLMNPGKLGFIGKVHNFVKTAYGIPDQLVRGAVYSKFIDEGVKKGMSEAAARRYAVENTNRYTQNYSNVAPAVDKLRNFPLVNPFISYTAEMGRILKNLAEDVAFNKNGRRWQSAGGLATILGLGAGINALIQSGLSPEDQEQVKQLIPLMPPYMKGKTAPIILRKDGKISSFNLNPWLPAEDFITTAKNIYNGDWDAVLANNPVAGGDRTPALNIFNEIRTGKDAIGQPSGGVLQSVQQNALPGWFPGVPGLTGPNYQAKKIVQGFTTNDQGARGITDSRGRMETPLSAIGSLFGISTATQDEQKLRERPLLDAKEAIKGEQDKLKRIFGSNVPQATKDEALADFQGKARRILRKAGVND